MMNGIQLWGVLKDQKEGTAETLKKLRRIGFDCVEPCVSLEKIPGLEHVIWPVERFRKYAKQIKDMELEIVSCHIMVDDIALRADEARDLAAEYGIRQFVVKSPENLEEENLRRTAEQYAKAAEILSGTGVELLVHNESNDILTHCAGKTAYEYLLGMCAGKVGAQVDVGWVYAGGEDPEMLLLRNKDIVRSVHIKDFHRDGLQLAEVVPGKGNVDIKTCLKFARADELPCIIDMDSLSEKMEQELSAALAALQEL